MGAEGGTIREAKRREEIHDEEEEEEEEEETGQDRARPAALGCACIRPRNLDCRHTSTSTTFSTTKCTHTNKLTNAHTHAHAHVCVYILHAGVYDPLFTQTNEPVGTYAPSGCNLYRADRAPGADQPWTRVFRLARPL